MPLNQLTRWKRTGKNFYAEENIKHLELVGVEAYSMAGEEVYGNSLAKRESKASLFKIEKPPWIKEFHPARLGECNHYQIMFYDENYDVGCKKIKPGQGLLSNVRV